MLLKLINLLHSLYQYPAIGVSPLFRVWSDDKYNYLFVKILSPARIEISGLCAADREMGSREKGPAAPLLSSLVVRPADSDVGTTAAAGGATGSDYEPGEVRRDPPPHSRSDRYDGHGTTLFILLAIFLVFCSSFLS